MIGLQPGQPRYRILITDDVADNRKLLVSVLAPCEFELREAGNGQEALEMWNEWRPHLIWMDIRMPVMDGLEATRRIRAAEQGKETIIIALSASAFEDEREHFLNAGCDDFVRKPYRESEIFEKIAQYLNVGYECAPEALPEPPVQEARAGEDAGLLISPSHEALKELHHLARYGDMEKISEWADALAAEDAKYEPFATGIQRLAKGFREQEILTFVETCLAQKNGKKDL